MPVVYQKLVIVGPSLLEVTCRQHSDGMRHIVLTIDALYTNAALSRISASRVDHRWWCKNATKCNIFLLIMDSPGGLPLRTYIFESPRRADVKC